MLMNIGPCGDGTIASVFQERLKQIGSWLKVNGEAVYSSAPYRRSQNDTINPDVYYTTKASTIYAFLLKWPKDNVVTLGVPLPKGSTGRINMLGVTDDLDWVYTKQSGLKITLPTLNPEQMPCQWAWVLKFSDFY